MDRLVVARRVATAPGPAPASSHSLFGAALITTKGTERGAPAYPTTPRITT